MTPQKPYRILFIIDYWASPGGTERHLSYLMNSLDRTRFECSVVIFNYQRNDLVDEVKANGMEVIHLPVARYYTPSAMLQAIKLFKLIRRKKIDLVQAFHYKADIYGAVVARLAGVKFIVSSKRDAADYKTAFRFFLHRLVRPITCSYIAVSEVVAKVIRDKEKVPASKILTIYNGVNLDSYSVPTAEEKSLAKQALGFRRDDFVIGMSAWFRPEKDHRLLIDAYLQVRAKAPNAKLVLVGGGPLLVEYQQWVSDHGEETNIKLVGPVANVGKYLNAFDVACLVPNCNEGFSNSVLEKMATGLPLVVTDIGGNKEAVLSEGNGYVIKAGDQPALVGHLLRLESDEELRNRMALLSRRRAEELFSLKGMIVKHEQLYQSIFDRNRSST